MSEIERAADRRIVWEVNKILFDKRLEKTLAHCPNMNGMDDMRDLCKDHCPLYKHYCISIEPNFDHLDGSEKNGN